ncbi:hypothetical protein HRR80_007552 [Exophiala dermatitidis]|uniref:MFS transporter, MCP family, solute carrier family 16 (Monocarboxylic acid transporters), member 7 n=2 Tax=Exophiala dermatitidis TaxID=5970 RepID=H6CA45_EXODN|nr:MFS transporter, MCP family, solute carrier family 16 (monocarboxylic acid transporters), member 7 [Exophiala dermatitidis NIH/UT8656]KAJ4530562.1 hypothetical protein HRR76_008269 [Exophiala dermatitidis]EHY60009.1 MFS transporter, MCP family, solute carrier family 16 (monocarboxylic acid transporters), member 7 [Exophiala dermatitidis NIH/UT8656]KAJ4545268.1 hypothetical protein HRR77_005118 [Exophiala dermatitidis]KAJ4570827.1 hypothetical protein HRR79_003759 [Exophiala dermatitidis]KAJ
MALPTMGASPGANDNSDMELTNANPVSGPTPSPDQDVAASPPVDTKPSQLHQVTVVLAGFVVVSMTCSIVFSFGVYQALYEEMAKQPNTPFTGCSSALIGLIGTLALSLMTMGGPLTLNWAKLHSPQVVISAGGILFGVAFILASFSQYLWEFALTQGLLVGLGTCMSYVPMTAVGPAWFDKRRGLAMGLIISGTGVGGMIWPPILRALIEHVGFRNAMRVSGSICAVLVAVAGFALAWEPKFEDRIRVETRPLREKSILAQIVSFPRLDWQVEKSKKFIAQALGNFTQAAGYSTPLFFYAAYAQSRGYSATAAANFITLSNAANFVSRIIIGHAADKLGRLYALFGTTLVSAVAVLGFWLPSTFCNNRETCSTKADVLFFFFTVLYGSFASAYISLFPATLLELFGVQHFTGVNSALYLLRGMGALLGTPLTALLISQSTALSLSRTYIHAAITVGVLMAAVAAFSFWVRLEATAKGQRRWKM